MAAIEETNVTTSYCDKISDFSLWERFRRVEQEIIERLGIQIWNSLPPVSPEYLIHVKKTQTKRKTNDYELKVLKALVQRGLIPDFQSILFNRRVCDFSFLKERIIIEIDDDSHSNDECKAKDKAKDEFALQFDFITFRLKHPYTSNELNLFCEIVELAFLNRGGIKNNYSPFIVPETAKRKKLEPTRKKLAASANKLLKDLYRAVPNGKKLRALEILRLRKLGPQARELAIKEIREEFDKKRAIIKPYEKPKKIEAKPKVILRRKVERPVPFDITGTVRWRG